MTDPIDEQHENHTPSDNNSIPDDKVGYGRPPKEHQFKPGQSGNPAGCPKKAKSATFGETLRNLLDETSNVQIRGQERKVTNRELIMRALLQHAMKGRIGAMRELIRLLESDTRIEDFEADEFDQDLLKDFIKSNGPDDGGDDHAKN